MGLLSHAWSLSLEEQFYFLWPIVQLVLLKLHSRWLVLLTTAGLSVGCFF